MKTNMSVNDVRAICKALIEMDGDVTRVSEKCGFPATLILRIKNKEYMKAISDSYFDTSRFNKPATGVREPERVVVTEVITPEPEPTPTPVVETPEVTPEEIPAESIEAPVEETSVVEVTGPICLEDFESDAVLIERRTEITVGVLITFIQKIITGVPATYAARDVGITKRLGVLIRKGEIFRKYTEKYFKVVDGDTIINNETGVKYTAHRGGIFCIRAENPDGTCENMFPKPVGCVGRKKKTKTPDSNTPESTSKVKAEPIKLDVSPSVIGDITDLAVKLLLNKKIADLPVEIIEKIIPILSEYTDNLTLREIKELMG